MWLCMIKTLASFMNPLSKQGQYFHFLPALDKIMETNFVYLRHNNSLDGVAHVTHVM